MPPPIDGIMAMLLAAVVQGFAGSARPGHATLGSARSAVSMATGNPIGAILEKAGIDIPGPDISGLPPQVARALVPRSAHHSPLTTHHSLLTAHGSLLTAQRSPPSAHHAGRCRHGRRRRRGLRVRGQLYGAWAQRGHLRREGSGGRRRRAAAEARRRQRQGLWVRVRRMPQTARTRQSPSLAVFCYSLARLEQVSKSESVEELGRFAKEKLGTINHWINNAGINGGRRPFTSLTSLG